MFPYSYLLTFPGSDGKESFCNAGDLSLIPGSGRSPGEGKSYPVQYSCVENPMDRGAWRAVVHRVTKSQTQLSDLTVAVGSFVVAPLGFSMCSIISLANSESFTSFPDRKSVV